tara:strand:+ start:151 stop:372 length:222 start_codon:yes stop_codon:yes gene_type:complete
MTLTKEIIKSKGFIKKVAYPYTYWVQSENGTGLRLSRNRDEWEVSVGDDGYGIVFNRITTEEKLDVILEAFTP